MKKQLLMFFILTFALTWGLAAAYMIFPQQMKAVFGPLSFYNILFIIAVWSPSIIGIVTTCIYEGKKGIVDLLRRIIPPKVNPFWYFFAILLYPVLTSIVNIVLYGKIKTSQMTGNALSSFLWFNLVTGPLGEELGWRGFALPRLLKENKQFRASIILGIVWTIWHLPKYVLFGIPNDWTQIIYFFFACVLFSVIVTFLYIHTNGNIFMAILIHYFLNFSITAIGQKYSDALIVVLIILFGLVVYEKVNKRKEMVKLF